MNIKRIIRRLSYFPLSFLKAIVAITNEKARDIENRRRYPQAKIDSGVTITPGSIIATHARLCKNVIFNHSSIGQYSYVNYDSLIQNTIIGNYCSIAYGVKIGLGNHPTNQFTTSPLFYKSDNSLQIKVVDDDFEFEEYKQILIGNDVWIGAGAIVLDGVKIGDGAIVAAGTVVTKDVPPYSIVGGVPAKIIKFRFSDEKIDAIMKTNWWLKNPEEILADRLDLSKVIED